MLAFLLAALVAQAQPVPDGAPGGAVVVRVVDRNSGCVSSQRRDCDWTAVAGGIASEFGALTTAELAAIRRRILDAPRERDDLLARIGFTPQTFAANRARILASAWPRDIPRPDPLELPAEHAALLDYAAVAPHVLHLLLGRSERSTLLHEVVIEIAGDPAIRVETSAEQPFLLPWKITVGGEVRISEDVEVSRALVPLLDPEGPNRGLLDGERYWTEEFWSERRFWVPEVGGEIEMALSTRPHTQLAGYREAIRRFRLGAREVGHWDGPSTIEALLFARGTARIERVSWTASLDGNPGSTWSSVLRHHAAAERAVACRPWLCDRSTSSPKPTLELRILGEPAPYEWADPAASAAWKESRLTGAPDFELRAYSGNQVVATLWLTRDGEEALLSTRWPTAGESWRDALFGLPHGGFSRAFGVVDGQGRYRALRGSR